MLAAAPKRNKAFLALAASFFTIVLVFISTPRESLIDTQPSLQFMRVKVILNGEDEVVVQEWKRARKDYLKNLTKLGEILFLDAPEPKIPSNSRQKYQILIWKYGRTIENRHIKNFSGQKLNPFEHCSVNNCEITYEDAALETADLVIFHLHRLKGLQDLPKRRNYTQIWTFLTDESPHHTFLNSKDKLKLFNNQFNWSMTYRSDSDIPVPYGRTIMKPNPDREIETVFQDKRRDVLVAILGSNCGGNNHRWDYVRELQKYIDVDIYGACGQNLKQKCPGHFGNDCDAISNYLFYLAFENSNCNEYITEKLWWNAYHKNSIPIVMGSSPQTYKTLLPPGSYINVDDFAKPETLADYLSSLNKTESFKEYYRWKSHFAVLNEHGYFQSKSYHYCRVCQALNYNTKQTKVYEDLEKFWSVQGDCHEPWNAPFED
ncbi:glycoprotein 3-alpha-L-fucosyltransferase A-like isoform X2 [Euwallacea fornicatus]